MWHFHFPFYFSWNQANISVSSITAMVLRDTCFSLLVFGPIFQKSDMQLASNEHYTWKMPFSHCCFRSGWTKSYQPQNWVGRKNAAVFISVTNDFIWTTVPENSAYCDVLGELADFRAFLFHVFPGFLLLLVHANAFLESRSASTLKVKFSRTTKVLKGKAAPHAAGAVFHRFHFRKIPSLFWVLN